MSSHIFTCLGIVLALSACAGRPRAARPKVDRALGCYVVRTEVGSSQRGWFPDTIALLSSRSKDGPAENTYRVRLTDRQARRMSLLSFGWRNVGADSLEIVEVVSRSMKQLRLKVPRTELSGARNLKELIDMFEHAAQAAGKAAV